MICLILFSLSVALYEASGRPHSDVVVQSSMMTTSSSFDRYAVLRMCRRPVANGSSHCQLKVKQYYYDGHTKSCVRFPWTGCGGNENRFQTLSECEERCAGVDYEDCKSLRPRTSRDGCSIYKAINIDGCPSYHLDCPEAQRTGSCPPVNDYAPLPHGCTVVTIRTPVGCPQEIVTCPVRHERN